MVVSETIWSGRGVVERSAAPRAGGARYTDDGFARVRVGDVEKCRSSSRPVAFRSRGVTGGGGLEGCGGVRGVISLASESVDRRGSIDGNGIGVDDGLRCGGLLDDDDSEVLDPDADRKSVV